MLSRRISWMSQSAAKVATISAAVIRRGPVFLGTWSLKHNR